MTFNNPVVGGENGELIRASIKSPGFLTLVQGWIIRRDGSAEFNNILIRGGAIVGGSITVGPSGMPQVIIDANATEGFIEFPTGAASEVTSASIYSEVINSGLANERMRLNINGAQNSAGDQIFMGLLSSAADGSVGPLLSAVAGNGSLTLSDTQLTSSVELFVAPSGDANYPARVVRGRVETASNSTTISKVSDTLISQAATASTHLENGVAYKVDVQIRTSASAGTSAAGTQGVNWKLWDGAVGGTQLGSSAQVYTDSVGTRSSSQQFSFVFEHTGTTGSRTLNLSGIHFDGADTLIATTSAQFYLIVNRIGRASNIVNL